MNQLVIKRDGKLDYFSMGKYLVKVGVVAACDKFEYYSHYSSVEKSEDY